MLSAPLLGLIDVRGPQHFRDWAADRISDWELSAVVDRGGADQKGKSGAGEKHHRQEI
jgi:hypothetical protein